MAILKIRQGHNAMVLPQLKIELWCCCHCRYCLIIIDFSVELVKRKEPLLNKYNRKILHNNINTLEWFSHMVHPSHPFLIMSSVSLSMNDPSLSANLLDLRIGPEEEVLVILLHGFLTLLTLLAIPNSAIYNDNNITILF